MDKQKLRRLIVLMHLCGAAFMAPAFILVSISGGLYLIGNKGAVESETLSLAPDAELYFKSGVIETQVRNLLTRSDIDYKFEYIKNRGNSIELRPTSRTYITLAQTPGGLTATRHTPNFQKSMIELHKGHGPTAFKTYQKLVALALFFVILGGLMAGLLSKVYRKKTLTFLAIGSAAFAYLALIA